MQSWVQEAMNNAKGHMKSTPYITGNAQYLEIMGKVSFNIVSEQATKIKKFKCDIFKNNFYSL